MWFGDEARNRYFQTTVTEAMWKKHGIHLRLVPFNQTSEAIAKLRNERDAGKNGGGSIDVLWINGENFRSAKEGKLLWGPMAQSIPNASAYPDWARLHDFGTAIDGFETPWQNSQFVMAYDSARTPQPPKSFVNLLAWVKQHPGRFTYVAPPDFTGSAFIRHILLYFSGGFQTGFDANLYEKASQQVFQYLNAMKPFLWKKGETYPSTPQELDRLFANQEIDFAMSYAPAFASEKIARGEFPATARTFVFESGTLSNYNFLAVAFNASNPQGALVVINDLVSYGRVLDMASVLGNGFPHALEKLTDAQRKEVDALPHGVATLAASEREAHAIPEPDAEYLNRLNRDWRKSVLLR